MKRVFNIDIETCEHCGGAVKIIAHVIDRFTQAIGLKQYTLYVQDYGAPVGLRLALLHPERVSGLIVQNGNAYAEGLTNEWEALRAYWREPTQANREKLRGWLSLDGARFAYSTPRDFPKSCKGD